MQSRVWVAVGILLLCFDRRLAAQAIQELATTEDGSVVYFASPVRQQESGQSAHWKIFQWDEAGGLRVAAEVRDRGEFDGCTTKNFYELRAPQVSADGRVFAYTAQRPVLVGRFCPPQETSMGVVRRGGREIQMEGNIALTPNGRYAVTTPSAAVTSRFHIVTDLDGGEPSIVWGALDASRQRLTDDGVVVTPEAFAVVLTDRMGQSRVLRTQQQVGEAVINSRGDTVVYFMRGNPGNAAGSISTIDVTSGRELQLPHGSGLLGGRLSMTSDGKTVLYVMGGGGVSGIQLYATGAGGVRQITSVSDDIADGVISGDGRVAYAVTSRSRLLRIDMVTGGVREIIPSTVFVSEVNRVFTAPTRIAAIGSVLELRGPVRPFMGTGPVREVRFCGKPVAFWTSDVGAVQFQVPWEEKAGECELAVRGESTLEHAVVFEVREFDPQFMQFGPSSPLLYHEGFRGGVTSSSPATPGEIVTAYMSGLGPVEGSSQVMPGFGCRVNHVGADVLYAGLAPGLTGTYQVNIRVPRFEASNANLICGWGVEREAVTTLWLGPG